MNPSVRVTAFVVAIGLVTIVFDAAQYAVYGWKGTISFLALSRASRYPIIAVAIGVLLGHLFWPQPTLEDEAPRDGTPHQ